MRDARIREEITHGFPHIWRVKLLTTLALGGSASARLVVWNGTTWADSDIPCTVWDSLGLFTGVLGDHFWAVYRPDSNRFELFSGIAGNGRPAEIAFTVVGSAFTKSSSTFTVTVTQVFGETISGAGSGATPITVTNPIASLTAYLFEGEVGYVGHAFYDYNLGTWRARFVECA